MSPFQSVITRYLHCVSDAWHALWRSGAVMPFAILSLIELLVMTGYGLFAVPPFFPLWPAAMSTLFGAEILHYPQHVLRMPDVMGWVRAGVAVVGGFVLLGWGLRVIDAHIVADTRTETASGRWPLVEWFVVCAAWTAVLVALVPLLDLLGELRIVGRLLPIWQTLAVLARPLTLAATAFAMYSAASGAARGGVAALRQGARFMVAHRWETLLLAATAAVLAGPWMLVMSQKTFYVRHANPGMVILAVSCAVLWDAIVRLFVFAGAASLERNPNEEKR